MTTNKSGKIRIYLYVLLTIAGCVFACSSIIPNDLSLIHISEPTRH